VIGDRRWNGRSAIGDRLIGDRVIGDWLIWRSAIA
jgi:hypothetical protein